MLILGSFIAILLSMKFRVSIDGLGINVLNLSVFMPYNFFDTIDPFFSDNPFGEIDGVQSS